MTGVVSIVPSVRQKHSTYRSIETLTASTSTTPQVISVETDVTILGGSTVTQGALNNLYTMADGVQGQEKLIQHATATGAASVIFNYPNQRQGLFDGSDFTATQLSAGWVSGTGMFVMQADGDFLLLRFIGSDWQIISMAGATQATTT